MANQQAPTSLTDEQVERFITDGFIIVGSNLGPSFHTEVSEQIAYTLENEIPHPGDNIAPMPTISYWGDF